MTALNIIFHGSEFATNLVIIANVKTRPQSIATLTVFLQTVKSLKGHGPVPLSPLDPPLAVAIRRRRGNGFAASGRNGSVVVWAKSRDKT